MTNSKKNAIIIYTNKYFGLFQKYNTNIIEGFEMTEQKTIFVKPADVERKWYIIDAKDKVLGKVAVATATLLRGKHKPCFTPHQEIGDYVVIINADKVVLTGKKTDDKMYYRHSGYPGSLKEENYTQLNKRKPGYPLKLAIKRMLPQNKLGRKIFTNAKIFAGDTHQHAAQQPTVYEV